MQTVINQNRVGNPVNRGFRSAPAGRGIQFHEQAATLRKHTLGDVCKAFRILSLIRPFGNRYKGCVFRISYG
ncbi:MAG: hypothetical protein DRH56_01630 [Deltaproteobacteria bacterium]|nr:MAG: hypothetical protein DRH56_01630 [Deltaproteobacteria bacterium]